MEPPIFGHEGLPLVADQAGHSEYGPASEDDCANMPQYNIALNMRMTDGNLALDVTGTFGGLGRLEYSTNRAHSDTNQFNRAPQLELGAANQPSHIWQNVTSGTWLPVGEMTPMPACFNQQPIVPIIGFDASFGNANLIVPVSDGNNTYLVGSTADHSASNYWAIASEPQVPDPITLEPVESHSNMGGFYFNDPNIDHVNPGASFQTLPYSTASHTNNSPVPLPTPVPNGHGTRALVTTDRKAKKKKRRSTALVSRIIPCATCWGLEKKCEGLTYCNRCTSKGIPPELCIRVRLKDVLTFDKYLRDEYKSKVVYVPCDKSEESTIVTLQHDPNGHPVEVKCYQFVPDLKIPHQTRTFWQGPGPNPYEEIETTTWSLTKEFLDLDLEPYIVKNIPIFVQKACNGPRETAVIFESAWKLIDRPIIFLGFKLHVALKMLMKGWSISGNEHLGMPTLHAEGAPCDGEIPVPAVMERQLDYIFEALLAKWESDFCEKWETLAKNRRNSWRTELFLSTFLILHVMERDALRLKIRFGSREAMNGWKHPLTPTTLVQKTIHFCNTLLAHFRALQSKDPLSLHCLEEDLWRYAGNDPTAFTVMRTLQKHKPYLDSKSLVNQKLCDKFKQGDNDSSHFTWSSAIFGSTALISMEDYLGKGVPGWT